MALSKQMNAPNGASVSYHKVVKIEVSGDMTMATVTVGSWRDQTSFYAGDPQVWNFYVAVEIGLLTGATPLVDRVEQALLSTQEFTSAGIVSEAIGADVAAARVRKNSEINAWRWEANNTFFMFNGKQIACDQLSRSDITGVSNEVSLTGLLPASFPGAWKAMDNTYVQISDVATWTQFVKAMVAQGTANFVKAQQLKAMAAAATTVEQVESINWESIA